MGYWGGWGPCCCVSLPRLTVHAWGTSGPVSGATVSFSGGSSGTTGADGTFVISGFEARNYTSITVAKTGLTGFNAPNFTFLATDDLTWNVILIPTATSLVITDSAYGTWPATTWNAGLNSWAASKTVNFPACAPYGCTARNSVPYSFTINNRVTEPTGKDNSEYLQRRYYTFSLATVCPYDPATGVLHTFDATMNYAATTWNPINLAYTVTGSPVYCNTTGTITVTL